MRENVRPLLASTDKSFVVIPRFDHLMPLRCGAGGLALATPFLKKAGEALPTAKRQQSAVFEGIGRDERSEFRVAPHHDPRRRGAPLPYLLRGVAAHAQGVFD